MVAFGIEDVYNALSVNWSRGQEVYNKLKFEKGVNNPKISDWIIYVSTFQLPIINENSFYIKLNQLAELGLIEVENGKDTMSSRIRRTESNLRGSLEYSIDLSLFLPNKQFYCDK